MRKQKPTRRWLFTNRRNILIFFLVISVAGAGLIYYAYLSREQPAVVSSTPEYQTLLPESKPVDELGGWKRVSPPENDPVFAYVDTIGDATINVSQQPLPESFKGNVAEQTARLAEAYSASKTLEAGGIKAYLGTSSKGPQSVIFTTDELLVLIKSKENIPDDAWEKYISTLE